MMVERPESLSCPLAARQRQEELLVVGRLPAHRSCLAAGQSLPSVPPTPENPV